MPGQSFNRSYHVFAVLYSSMGLCIRVSGSLKFFSMSVRSFSEFSTLILYVLKRLQYSEVRYMYSRLFNTPKNSICNQKASIQ